MRGICYKNERVGRREFRKGKAYADWEKPCDGPESQEVDQGYKESGARAYSQGAI